MTLTNLALIITIINALVLGYLHLSFSSRYSSKMLELSSSSTPEKSVSHCTSENMKQLKDALQHEVNFRSILRPNFTLKKPFQYASEYPRAIHKHKEFSEQLKRREKASSEGIFSILPSAPSVLGIDASSATRNSQENNGMTSLRIQEYIIQMKTQFPEKFSKMFDTTVSHPRDLSEFSDHVFFEPNWDVSVTCPKYMSSASPSTRKNLGVYITTVGYDGQDFVNDKLREKKHAFDFRKVLSNWRDHFIRENPYPILIFHYGSIPETLQEQIRMDFHSENSIKIQFHSIHEGPFDAQTYMDLKNRFYLHELYKLPLVQSYEYLIKLDPQLVFLQPIPYDPFRFMKENHLLVGYSQLGLPDAMSVKSPSRNTKYQTLYEFVRLYTLQQGVLPLGEMREEGNFGTHDTMHTGPFEVVHLSVYNNAYYEHYLNFIDAIRGMNEERWSEQNVRTQWIKLYVSRMATHWFCDLFTQIFKIYFVPRCFIRCIH